MTVKYMAALAVFGILAVALLHTAGVQQAQASELAGADDGDKATKDQLKQAGQDQVPAEGMKSAQPKSEPSAMPVSQPAPQPMAKPAAQPMAKPAEPMMAASPSLAGPYLRLDVGYGLTTDPDGTDTGGAMSGEDVGNLAIFGGGLGYRFNENLRADLTADYRPDADVDATNSSGTAVASEINGLTVMANAYYDIGVYSGFAPYIGAGIGMARLETADQTGSTANGDTSLNLAWALMVGTAIDLGMGDKTFADVSYRFINRGEFKQEGGTEYDDLMVHEFRAGMRHFF